METNSIKYCIATFLSLALFQWAGAQQRISGTVRDKNGEVIPSAAVVLSPGGEATRTDSAGHFSLQTMAKGKASLLFTSIGYKPLRKEILLTEPALQLDIILSTNIQSLHAVTISAGSFEASDKAKGASLTAIDAFTVAGNNADLAMALRSLPGAQQIGELEGLFVRGGTGDETKQFMDGTLIKNPNYPSVPGVQQYARLNPILFKGILFSSGGYSATYGQAMSSALILESADLPEKSSAYFSVFSANQSAGMQKLARNGRSSYGVTVRYSNQALYNSIVPQGPDYFRGPEYREGDANFRIKRGKTGMLKFYTNWNSSDVGMRNPDIDSPSLRSSYRVRGMNSYNNLSYRDRLGQDWKLETGLAYDHNRVHTEEKNNQRQIFSDLVQGRVVLTRQFSNNQALRFGAEHFYSRDHGRSNDSAIALTDHLTAGFAEADLYLSEQLAARAGVRAEYSSVPGRGTVAPRLSLAWRMKDGGQFNLAYGIFYQEPSDDVLYQARDLRFSGATHYILNYIKKANNRLFRIEAYDKEYKDLVKIATLIGNGGKGYARGMEVFFRDKRSVRNLDYWVTYTYLDTRRDYWNYPYALRPSFATPHTATVAIKKNFQELNTFVNISYAFATGRPYYDIRYSAPDKGYKIYDQGTTKNYSVLNLQVAHLVSILRKSKQRPVAGFSAGVNNILGAHPLFGYNYSADGGIKMPVTLPATRYYYIGFFMSFGIDRTTDLLNNDAN